VVQSPIRLVAVLLITLAAALAGFQGYRSWQAHQSAGTQLTAVQSDNAPAKSPAPPSAAEAGTPAVPDTVPDLKLPDTTGQQKSLRDFLGHPLIINFWATWCAPCRREIPLLQQLRQTYKAEGLEVVGVAVDFQTAVVEYLQKTPISYPLLVGEDQGSAAAEKFGMEPVLPFSVFADAEGRIIAVKVGELHKDEADYILAAMHSVADGKQSLPDVRAGIAQKLHSLAIERAKTGNGES
jgi:thiol-disulfide isomerase/thioredoxin